MELNPSLINIIKEYCEYKPKYLEDISKGRCMARIQSPLYDSTCYGNKHIKCGHCGLHFCSNHSISGVYKCDICDNTACMFCDASYDYGNITTKNKVIKMPSHNRCSNCYSYKFDNINYYSDEWWSPFGRKND